MANDASSGSKSEKSSSLSIKKVELSKVGSPEEILEALSIHSRRLIQGIEGVCNDSRDEVYQSSLPDLQTLLATVANLAEILRLTGALQRLPAEVSAIEKPTRKSEIVIKTFLDFPYQEHGFQEWAFLRTSLIDLRTCIERFLELNLDLK